MNDDDGERRRNERKPCNAAFEFALHGECLKTFRPGTAVNVSESGLGIVSDCDLQPGQVIIFKSRENEADVRIAVVQWTMKTVDAFKAGLRFLG